MYMFKQIAVSSILMFASGLPAGAAWADDKYAEDATHVDTDARFESAAEISKASEWLGRRVVDENGASIGEVSDFAVNARNSSIGYAVISLEGFFNSNSIAVPLTALHASPSDVELLTLRVSQRELRAEQSFESDAWPLMATVTPAASGPEADTAESKPANVAANAAKQAQPAPEQTSADKAAPWRAAEQPKEQSTASLRDARFNRLDANGDGYLSADEIRHTEGLTTAESSDRDQDGRIGRSEFAAFEARTVQDTSPADEKSERSSKHEPAAKGTAKGASEE